MITQRPQCMVKRIQFNAGVLRYEHVPRQRQVSDGQPATNHERRLRQVRVDNAVGLRGTINTHCQNIPFSVPPVIVPAQPPMP